MLWSKLLPCHHRHRNPGYRQRRCLATCWDWGGLLLKRVDRYVAQADHRGQGGRIQQVMESSERVKMEAAEFGGVKESIEHLQDQVERVKVHIGKVRRINKVKAIMTKNEEVGRNLDLMTENMKGKSKALVELVEVIDTLLREVHEPPSLVDLAAGRVVEEMLGVGELPTTLKKKVEGLQEERMTRARKALDNYNTAIAHFETVHDDVMDAIPIILNQIRQLIRLQIRQNRQLLERAELN